MSQEIEGMIRASVIAILIFAAAAGQPARAADPVCKLVLDAIAKQIVTPSHLYATDVMALRGGKPRTTESIYTGGAIYVQVKGQWKRSPMSVQDMQKQRDENVRNAKSMTCRYLRDEAVNGEAAAVYDSQAETEDGKSASTLWVSKRSGLPLRSESDIDLGGGEKMHLTIRYDYAGVRPPAGVN